MCGLTAPGTSRAYYVCPHNPNNPRHAAASPDHVRAAFRARVIYDAVDGILGGLLGHDQAAVQVTAPEPRPGIKCLTKALSAHGCPYQPASF